MKECVKVELDINFFNRLEEALVIKDDPIPEKLERQLLIDVYKAASKPTANQLLQFETDIDLLLNSKVVLSPPIENDQLINNSQFGY